MNSAQEIDRAARAKAILESSIYQEAYKAVREALVRGIEDCPMKDTETADDFRRCLKLLNSVQINMAAALNAGGLAQFRLRERERWLKNPFRNINRDRA